MLAMLVGVQQQREERAAHPLMAQADQMLPLLEPLRQGQSPTAEMVKQADGTVLGPLMQALLDAQRQRQQALVAYQTQIEAVALGAWLTPGNLAHAPGRAQVRLRLNDLRAALDALVKRDLAVQTRLDESLLAWASQIPDLGDSTLRHDLVASTGSTANAMSTFFRVEHEIVAKVESLLVKLDTVGAGVSLEGGASQDLVFAHQEDLAFYQAALTDLNELGRREQQWLVAAEKASGQHARQVGDLIMATLDGAD